MDNSAIFGKVADRQERYYLMIPIRTAVLFDISASSSGYLADPTFESVREKPHKRRYMTETRGPQPVSGSTPINSTARSQVRQCLAALAAREYQTGT
jgi:hypothetical protein